MIKYKAKDTITATFGMDEQEAKEFIKELNLLLNGVIHRQKGEVAHTDFIQEIYYTYKDDERKLLCAIALYAAQTRNI